MRPHTSRYPRTRGFTLVEFTIAMSMTLALASSLMILLQQHLTMFQMSLQNNFLVDDAPKIGSILNRILNQVDHYFVYGTKTDALNGANPVNTGGVAVRLFFRTPTGSFDQGIIVAEASGSKMLLNYYAYKNGQWPTNASWTISSHVSGVQFANSTGILLAQLTGPMGEQVTYAGASQ